MSKLLIKESHHFEIDIPYELIETGSSDEKPLIVYLHGYKQNMIRFKKIVSSLLDIEAYHLFLQGPYVIYDEKHTREVPEWGRAWYLYDGDQDQFKRSLEKTSGYIQDVLDEISGKINSTKTILLGYSMGGYQTGYVALSRPDIIDEMIVVGGRIKTEYFSQNTYPDLKVLIVHGINDRAVSIQSVKKSAEELRQLKAAVNFYKLDEGHRLTQPYIIQIKKWLESETGGAKREDEFG